MRVRGRRIGGPDSANPCRLEGVSPFGPTTWSSGLWWLVWIIQPLRRVDRSGFQFRRTHAQASSGDVQSSAGAAPYRERPHWVSPQLSVMLWEHRAVTHDDAAGTAFSRHASLHAVRPRGAVHRRCCLARFHVAPNPACTDPIAPVRPPRAGAFLVLHGNITVGSPYPNQPGKTRESCRHRVQIHQQSHREGEDHLQWHASPEQ
jgi:hypothetical protein